MFTPSGPPQILDLTSNASKASIVFVDFKIRVTAGGQGKCPIVGEQRKSRGCGDGNSAASFCSNKPLRGRLSCRSSVADDCLVLQRLVGKRCEELFCWPRKVTKATKVIRLLAYALRPSTCLVAFFGFSKLSSIARPVALQHQN